LALVQNEALPPYNPDEIDDAFFGRIIRSSYYSEGPRLVSELLKRRGIHFVLLSHLPKTYLDGACFLSPAGGPIVGMTLRHDRLDNFWFTLVHELAHLKLHVHEDGPAFFDDTEHHACEDDDPREAEANAFARDRLISDTVWQQDGSRLLASNDDQDVRDLAERLEISPAIIAGRIRWEMKNYAVLTPLVGNGAVRCLFQDQLQP
jgi:HTH-type transcriptional regulator/antitoxin HigA